METIIQKYEKSEAMLLEKETALAKMTTDIEAKAKELIAAQITIKDATEKIAALEILKAQMASDVEAKTKLATELESKIKLIPAIEQITDGQPMVKDATTETATESLEAKYNKLTDPLARAQFVAANKDKILAQLKK